MRLTPALCALLLVPSVAIADDLSLNLDAPVDHPSDDSGQIAADTVVHFRAAAWLTRASGHISVGEAFPGTVSDLDFHKTLGLDTHELDGMASLGFNFGSEHRWHIDLGYTGHFDYNGVTRSETISFNDRIYSGIVTSHLQYDIFETTVAYDIVHKDPITFSIGAGARIVDFKASTRGLATDTHTNTTTFGQDSESAILPIPTIGAGLRWDITRRLYARAFARGLYAGNYGDFVDAQGELGFDFTANIGLFAGYRWIHAKADIRDVNLDFDLHGPYAGLEIRF
jgi:opacity protein-like surface antigen